MPKRRPPAKYKHIAFVASDVPEAQRARRLLVKRYGDVRPETADVIVALGGDGLMLATLQRFMNSGKPIYGMHRGTVGFLMNEYRENGLPERLAAAQVSVIHPLLMRARDAAAMDRAERQRQLADALAHDPFAAFIGQEGRELLAAAGTEMRCLRDQFGFG